MKPLLSGSYFFFRSFLKRSTEHFEIQLSVFLWQKLFLYSLIHLGFLFLLSSCQRGGFGLGGTRHCSQYTYSEERRTWVDSSGREAFCTIADGDRVFEYLPGEGCSYLKDLFPDDGITQFVKMPIRIGSGEYSIAQMYCVKQRYIGHDNTGQVLLIDEGVFCFTEHDEVKGEYVFKSCKGVQRKSKDNSKINNPT